MPEVTSHAPGTASWFELSTTDEKGAMEFYSAIFGWVDDPQPIYENWSYHMQKLNGLEAAAIYQQQAEERKLGVPPHWNTYFSVTNVDESVARVQQAGGSLLFGPMDVFAAGRMAMLQDRQGAAFAVWQAEGHIGCRVKGEPGAIMWNELMTSDQTDATEFYTGLLGLGSGSMEGPMEYTLLKVSGDDVAGVMPITEDMGPVPPNWMVYFGVANVDDTTSQAEALGAIVLVPGTDIPGVGRFATIQDPQGAVFGMFTHA